MIDVMRSILNDRIDSRNIIDNYFKGFSVGMKIVVVCYMKNPTNKCIPR
jgi:hypothetical protein